MSYAHDAETSVAPYFKKKTCHYTCYKSIKLTKIMYNFSRLCYYSKLLDLELDVGIRALTQLCELTAIIPFINYQTN
jgi:hypothetical protein